MKSLFSGAFLALIAGCQPAPLEHAQGAADLAMFKRNTAEWRGQKIARDRCSDCHAVEPGQVTPGISPPSFAVVANRPGQTREGLARWLRTQNSHPKAMYFEIPAERIDDISAYVIALRSGRH